MRPVAGWLWRPTATRKSSAAALDLGMEVMPGIATPTEAFAAIRAGATKLKLFPGRSLWHAVPAGAAGRAAIGIRMYPVGGVGAADIPAWLAAGADGFGFGGELFRPEYDLPEIGRRASQLVQAFWQSARRAHAEWESQLSTRGSSASTPSRSSCWRNGCRARKASTRRMPRIISWPAARCPGGRSAPR